MTSTGWDDATVAASDIARIAGVGRAAVANWRRRFVDFPPPVAGTAASPLFRLVDVEQWLAEHGRGAAVDPLDRLWQSLRGTADDLGLGELVGRLGVFLLFLQRDPAVWQDLAATADDRLVAVLEPAVAAAVPELPAGLPEPVEPGLLRALVEVADDRGADVVFGFLVDRLLRAHARRMSVTPAATADAVARIAGVTGRSALDPACGTGELLAAAAAAGATAVAGQDLDPTHVRLTGARLLLAEARAEVAAGDSLAGDGFVERRFGAVVCDPPPGDRGWDQDALAADIRWRYGLPPRTEPELAWLQHCLAHVEPGGTAVMIMPTAVAGRRAGRRIRSNLLRAGALRAVLRIAPEASGQRDLWVLRGPDGDLPAQVLLAGVDTAEEAAAAWETFRSRSPGGPAFPGSVPLIDLLDDEVDLSPPRHLDHSAPAAEVPALREAVESALRDAAATIPDLSVSEPPRSLSMTSVGDLVKAGALTVLQAPLATTVDDPMGLPALLVSDVVKHRAPSGRAADRPGTVRLQAGDVVTPALSGSDAEVVVIARGGVVLGPRLVALRPDSDRLDPHFLAGFLRAIASPEARGSAGRSRSDVRRVPIPLLSIAEQRAYGESVRRLLLFEGLLLGCVRDGEELVRRGFAGLRSGHLLPEA